MLCPSLFFSVQVVPVRGAKCVCDEVPTEMQAISGLYHYQPYLTKCSRCTLLESEN